MPRVTEPDTGWDGLMSALTDYADAIHRDMTLCYSSDLRTAIHDKGQALQVYRMYDRDSVTAKSLRDATQAMLKWESLPQWIHQGSDWQKIESGIESRMQKHDELLPILTEGITWENRPILIHAYKFETDPRMKVELVLPEVTGRHELPAQRIASAIRCHETLIPTHVAAPLHVFDGHESEFETVEQYLSHTMPSELYNIAASQSDDDVR